MGIPSVERYSFTRVKVGLFTWSPVRTWHKAFDKSSLTRSHLPVKGDHLPCRYVLKALAAFRMFSREKIGSMPQKIGRIRVQRTHCSFG